MTSAQNNLTPRPARGNLPEAASLLLVLATRMNQLRAADALCAFLVEAAGELCSPRRTLLLLETPTGVQIAGARLPRGESAPALLAAVTPWLQQAREQGAAALHIGPAGAAPAGQRCCIVAPLSGSQGTLGYLYCDIEGRQGRWSELERDQLALFATQAALALQNAGLFSETQEAREQQKATADILRAISESPTDVTPVFQAIAERARLLSGADMSGTTRFDGEQLHLVGWHGTSPQAEAVIRSWFPRRADRGTSHGRCILLGAPVQIPDVRLDPDYQLRAAARANEYRSLLAVPMLLGGMAIGTIAVGRHAAGEFPDKVRALLQTFADQAVIAIQNARLFNETQEALEQQTATSEVLKVIARSPDDVRPVFDTIVRWRASWAAPSRPWHSCSMVA
jgi:GAF domain-containing protein